MLSLENDWAVRGILIGESPRSKVYRLRQNEKSYVVKCTNPMDASREEKNWLFLRQQKLNMYTPRLVQDLSRPEEGIIIYEDDFLQSVHWSKPWIKHAVRQLSEVHRVSEVNTSGKMSSWQGQSHTPSIESVLRQLEPDFGHWIQKATAILGRRSRPHDDQLDHWVAQMIVRNQSWVQSEEYRQQIRLCHGDSHLGNFLWSRQKRKMYMIDWEYLQFNHVYFDLYQLFDATSPFTPLLRPISRDEGLAMYYQYRNVGNEMASAMPNWLEFRNRYFAYATIHLAWTMTRVIGDVEQRRFTLSSMYRQYLEIISLLRNIYRTSK